MISNIDMALSSYVDNHLLYEDLDLYSHLIILETIRPNPEEATIKKDLIEKMSSNAITVLKIILNYEFPPKLVVKRNYPLSKRTFMIGELVNKFGFKTREVKLAFKEIKLWLNEK